MSDKEWMDFIRHSIESHDRQIAELVGQVSQVTANVKTLVQVTNRDAVDIAALARIAESHERRLGDLEGSTE